MPQTDRQTDGSVLGALRTVWANTAEQGALLSLDVGEVLYHTSLAFRLSLIPGWHQGRRGLLARGSCAYQLRG